MPRLDEARPLLVATLLDRHGPPSTPGAGPIDFDAATSELGPFARIARTALGLIAEPRIASMAFAALGDAGLLEPTALAAIDPVELDGVLKQGRVKLAARSLRPLVGLARWAVDAGFDADRAASSSTEALRESWRGIKGVGPATVDAILLFGLGRATFPLDRATYRILIRHGWLDVSADYDEARSAAESLAGDDPVTLSRLSEAFVNLGREYCKPTVARCEKCPLRPLLPDGGPREVE